MPKDLAKDRTGPCILQSSKKWNFAVVFSKEAIPIFVNGAVQYIGRIA